MMARIIAISGKRGAGKSTLARYLDELGYEKLSLADELKRMAMREFRLSSEQVYGRLKEVVDKRYDKTPREILIRMGQFYREIDPLFWCKKVESFLNDNGTYVIDDIRFLNEIKHFNHYDLRLVRLERSQDLNVYKTLLIDSSECELDTFKDWDFLLTDYLNLDLDSLRNFARYIVDHIESHDVPVQDNA